MTIKEAFSDRKNLWADALLFGCAFALTFWALGDRALWGSEGRWAQVTREMFLTGDFFHPTIGGKPYFDKPLLTYWLIVAVKFLMGSLTELTIRIPSAVAGMVGIWATRKLGNLWSRQTGRLAGWFMLTCYGVIFWSRTAAADTENLAAIILCVAWYWYHRDTMGFKNLLILYLIAFVGAWTKGLVAVAVAAAAILPDIIPEGRWKRFIKPAGLAALLIAGFIYLSPFIYETLTRSTSYSSSGLALVFQENIQRYVDPIDHKNPFYIYLWNLPALLLPWAPLFIASLVGMVAVWKNLDEKAKWLLKAIAMVFLFFTISGSRRSYYILPIVPFCVLLMAVFINEYNSWETSRARKWGVDLQRYILLGMVAAELMLPAIVVILSWKKGIVGLTGLSVSGIIIGIAAIGASVLVSRKDRFGDILDFSREVRGLVVLSAIVMGGFFCWQYNMIDNLRSERSFAIQLREAAINVPCENIGIYPHEDAKLLFYLGKDKPLRNLSTPEDINDFMPRQSTRIMIANQKSLAILKKSIQEPTIKTVIDEKTCDWESKSKKNKKWVAWILKPNTNENNNGSANAK